MNNSNFGINLSSEEKSFMNEYCSMVLQYGDSCNFPLSNELKMAQYNRMVKLLNKLTPEELKEFSSLIERGQSINLDSIFENADKLR